MSAHTPTRSQAHVPTKGGSPHVPLKPAASPGTMKRAAPVAAVSQPLPVRPDSDDEADDGGQAEDVSGVDELIANLTGVQIEPLRMPPPRAVVAPTPIAAAAVPAPVARQAFIASALVASHAPQPAAPLPAARPSVAPSSQLHTSKPSITPTAVPSFTPSAILAARVAPPAVPAPRVAPSAAPPVATYTPPPRPASGIQLPTFPLSENPYLETPAAILETEVAKQTSFLASSAKLLASLPDKGAALTRKLAQLQQALPIVTAKEAAAKEKQRADDALKRASATTARQPAAGSLVVDASRFFPEPAVPFVPAATSAAAASAPHALFGRSSKIQLLSMDSAKDYMPAPKYAARGTQHGFYSLSTANPSAGAPKSDAVDENDLVDLLKSLNQLSVDTTTKPSKSASSSSASVAAIAPVEPELVIPGLRSTTKLLPHQVHAVRWMQKRELSTSEPRGGLIADDCGLGKTLQMASLILLSLSTEKDLPVMPRPAAAAAKKKSASAPTPKPQPDYSSSFAPSCATLIICPKAVLNSWRLELEKHLDPDWVAARGKPLRILTYHGPEKKKWSDSKLIARKANIVLTTYETVLRERSPKKGNEPAAKKKNNNADSSSSEEDEDSDYGLMGVYWRRIVLDESHHVRNWKTETCKSLCNLLEGERRWAMSGTPLQNGVDDLYSTFWFLRFEPYAQLDRWKALVSKHPSGARHGLEVLRTLLSIVALRRTKADKLPNGAPLIALPPKHFQVHLLDFTPREKQFYDELWAGYREELERQFGVVRKPNQQPSIGATALLTAQHKSALRMSDLLVKLLRLRQTCGHFLLAVEGMRQSMRNKASKGKAVRGSDRNMERVVEKACRRIQIKLEQQDNPTSSTTSDSDSDGSEDEDNCCGICFDPLPASPTRVLTTRCRHDFCVDCLKPLLLEEDELDCPTCDKEIKLKDFKKQLDAHEKHAATTGASDADYADFSSNDMMVDYVEQQLSGASSSSAASVDVLATTKLSFLLSQLHSIKSQASTASDKVIIFSQWTSMLDLIQVMLDKEQERMDNAPRTGMLRPSFHYTRLDGAQSSSQQHANLIRFQAATDPSDPAPVSIFLISLKAGGTGLNLTAASHLFLCDLWWNPGVEVQAFDRVYRVGQTKPVHIHKLIIRGSVEETLYEMQQQKLGLAFGVLDAERKGRGGMPGADDASLGFKKSTGMTLAELKQIFLGK